MDLNDVERINLAPLGGSDSVVVNDLSGGDVSLVSIDLANDLAADSVSVNATGDSNVITVAAVSGTVQVTGLAAQIDITNSESATDTLTISGLGGDDTISGGTLAGLIRLTLDGGAGNDTLNGGNGADQLLGGEGNDAVDGNAGADTAFLGAGDDTFTWDPGDGSDAVDGEDGFDTLRFNGAAGAEIFTLSAGGGQATLARNLGNITMNLDDVEHINLLAQGGADNVVVNNLVGSDVTLVSIDLGALGGGDAAADSVSVNATSGSDVLSAAAVSGTVQVTGLAAQINITGSEPASDMLTISGLGGDDTISAGFGLAALIRLTLDGGAGNDFLNGGNGADQLLGGEGNDSVDGNAGADTAFLGAGDDTFTWDPGDGSDIVEGEDGVDALRFNGSAASEIFTISASGGRALLTRNLGNITMDLNDVERISVSALGGSDSVVVNDLSSTGVSEVFIDLGAAGGGDAAPDSIVVNYGNNGDVVAVVSGNGTLTLLSQALRITIVNFDPLIDTLAINGLGGNDVLVAAGGVIGLTLNGGDGDDVLVGSQGNDTINGENGNDILMDGDGNDTIDGGAGGDLLIEGAGIDVSINATVIPGPLTSAGPLNIPPPHVGSGGSTVAGGGQVTSTAVAITVLHADQFVTVSGTEGNDAIGIAVNGSMVEVSGLGETQVIDPAVTEELIVAGLGGDDTISASSGLAGLIRLTLDGGAGNDTLNGGNGADQLLGGEGNDAVDGNAGADTAFLGAGDDTFTWDPGDGSDAVDGEDGFDTLRFNGAAGAEIFTLSAGGGQATLARNLGNITMNLDDVEHINLLAQGGADNVVVNNLVGSDVTLVSIDLGALGGGDAAADSVSVNATSGSDVLSAAAVSGTVQVTGLAAQINITGSEPASDMLTISGLGGDDTISAGFGLAALIRLTLDGGAGNDFLNGGNGADQLLGGEGNDSVDGNAGADTAFLGAGDDTFTWDPGDGSDIVEGEDGVDALRFNGSAASEIFTISASGGRALLTRNLGNITMDLNDVERISVSALGGSDSVVVNDLSSTGVSEVFIDLGAAGGGDAAPDSIVVNYGNNGDVVAVVSGNGTLTLLSQALRITIVNFDPLIDTLAINGLGGNDVLVAAGGVIGLTLNGGDGDDVLVGSQGNDTINGENGNDILMDGDGNDTVNGGAGEDLLVGGTGLDFSINVEQIYNDLILV